MLFTIQLLVCMIHQNYHIRRPKQWLPTNNLVIQLYMVDRHLFMGESHVHRKIDAFNFTSISSLFQTDNINFALQHFIVVSTTAAVTACINKRSKWNESHRIRSIRARIWATIVCIQSTGSSTSWTFASIANRCDHNNRLTKQYLDLSQIGIIFG